MVDALVHGTGWGSCWCMIDALFYGIGWVKVGWYMLVHGWCIFFMVQVDYRLFGIGWCMVDALVCGTGCLV